MQKKYNHKEVEQGKNKKWIDNKYFSNRDNAKDPFTIILPPPNVTGKLHLGHAWDGYIQDTLIRFQKLNGYDVHWVPGMDHAGIATQAKVEERLREKNITRYDLGREKFLDKVWEWKEEYATTIRTQWGTLGLALDYPSERFTMDEGLSDAVTKVFIDLYKRKLIYRGERAINWDVQLQTVLSNIEVENKETKSKMYYIKYPLKNSGYVQVATTRPETMFSDVAIAVNPRDEKMNRYIGKVAISPLTGLELPIIADEYIEIGKGTGAMKVSAHAEADITIIKNNDLEVKECIDKLGLMNKVAGELEGFERFEARKRVVSILKDVIIKEEDIVNNVGYSQRSNTIVETLVQPQWFVDMKPMADLIIKDIKSGEGTKFYPDRFEDTLMQWMENIQDWCISRQLWWGHRIPAWYKGDEVKVQEKNPGDGWEQDNDVLDTWFSSGIAPFSFQGWPEKTKELEKFYPTQVLVTGYDIIFFWVARMYFQSLDIMGEKPFEDVLIHGLIRDAKGRKMSKSLGNGIDPMDVIDKYGSDSLRWFLLTNSSPGQDIRYSEEKIEAAWGISNKLWNISRYILEVMEERDGKETVADKWIMAKLAALEEIVSAKMKEYEFTIIGKELTSFITEDFSSWYIEMSKEAPNKAIAKRVLEKLLIIMHPFMPFITDHIYTLIDGRELLNASWTKINSDKQVEEIDRAIAITKLLREFRHSKSISNAQKLCFHIDTDLSELELKVISRQVNAEVKENKDAHIPFGKLNIYVELTSEMKSQDKERIAKQISHLEAEIKRAKGMLSNESFISKAPENKVKLEKEKLANFEIELAKLKEN